MEIADTDYLSICVSHWEKIQSLLSTSSYAFSISYRDNFDTDYMDSDYLSNNKVEPTFLGQSTFVSGIYNEYASQIVYEKYLNSELANFQESFIRFIDATAYSVGERLQLVANWKYDLEKQELVLFKKYKDFVLHKHTRFSKNNDPEWEGFWDSELEYESVVRQVSSFVRIQQEFYEKLNSLMRTSLVFLPGRLQDYIDNNPEKKINLLLSRVESIQLLLVLRQIGIISSSTKDNELARFAEANLLWQQYPLTSVKPTISQLKNHEISSSPSTQTLIEKFKNITV